MMVWAGHLPFLVKRIRIGHPEVSAYWTGTEWCGPNPIAIYVGF